MNPDTCMKAICRYGRKCVLLNGCEAWALTVADEKSLVYTSFLRKALDVVSWEKHVDFYGKLPRLTDKIQTRRKRMRVTGQDILS